MNSLDGCRIHTAGTWVAAILFHLIADYQPVRDNRDLNLIVGLAMKYWDAQ